MQTKQTNTMRICLFVCLSDDIKPVKLYSASCVGREVNPLKVITHGQRYKAGNLHVRGSCKIRGPQKITQLISTRLVRKTGYETGNSILRRIPLPVSYPVFPPAQRLMSDYLVKLVIPVSRAI